MSSVDLHCCICLSEVAKDAVSLSCGHICCLLCAQCRHQSASALDFLLRSRPPQPSTPSASSSSSSAAAAPPPPPNKAPSAAGSTDVGPPIVCPVCLAPTSPPFSPAEEARARAAEIELQAAQPKACAFCGQPAAVLCEACSTLCAEHDSFLHSRGPFVSHSRRKLDMGTRPDSQQGTQNGGNCGRTPAAVVVVDRPMMCLEHGKEADLFCSKEKVLVCAHCLLTGSHKGHEYSAVKQAAEVARKEISENSVAITKKAANINEMSGALTRNFAEAKQEREIRIAQVKSFFSQAHQILDTVEAEKLADIANNTKPMEQSLAKQIESCDSLKLELERIGETVTSILRSGSDRVCLALWGYVDHLAKSLCPLGTVVEPYNEQTGLAVSTEESMTKQFASLCCIETSHELQKRREETKKQEEEQRRKTEREIEERERLIAERREREMREREIREMKEMREREMRERETREREMKEMREMREMREREMKEMREREMREREMREREMRKREIREEKERERRKEEEERRKRDGEMQKITGNIHKLTSHESGITVGFQNTHDGGAAWDQSRRLLFALYGEDNMGKDLHVTKVDATGRGASVKHPNKIPFNTHGAYPVFDGDTRVYVFESESGSCNRFGFIHVETLAFTELAPLTGGRFSEYSSPVCTAGFVFAVCGTGLTVWRYNPQGNAWTKTGLSFAENARLLVDHRSPRVLWAITHSGKLISCDAPIDDGTPAKTEHGTRPNGYGLGANYEAFVVPVGVGNSSLLFTSKGDQWQVYNTGFKTWTAVPGLIVCGGSGGHGWYDSGTKNLYVQTIGLGVLHCASLHSLLP
ncbi:tripartite motif-containing protein 50/73/74 [Pelomyxa schiedti]|nr:tripartite motif-containing protein 50/73/74 [Pelomyxa schiedti]